MTLLANIKPSFFIQKRWLLLYLAFWSIYFCYFWLNVFQVNDAGDLTIGQANMWADWALHFTLTNVMASRELIPSGSPLLLDAPFSYPFASNLVSALLIKLGLNQVSALIYPSLFFSLLLIIGLYLFFYELFNRTAIALVASCLFLFNGGIGFYYLIEQGLANSNLLTSLINPVIEVTNLETEQIKWMSVVNSLFIPQRSLLMGFSISVIVLTLLLRLFSLNNINTIYDISKIRLVMLAILIGLMPIIHLHSFLALFIILSCWMLADLIQISAKQRLKRLLIWIVFVAIVSSIALPFIFVFYGSQVSQHNFSFHLGWMAKDYQMNWFLFWFKNWTIVPLLALIGWFLCARKDNIGVMSVRNLLLFLPFFVLFVMVNLISMQPWIWDNTKLLIWASLGFSGLTAYTLFVLYKRLVQNKKLMGIKVIVSFQKMSVGLLFLLIIFSGALDIYRNIRLDSHRYTLYTANELDLAQWVKSNTNANSIWLTSTKHNHWLFNLTGRQAVMTYPGWLWSHGLNYQQTEQDIKKMFNGVEKLLFTRYRINYVVLDNHAMKNFKANRVKLLNQYSLIKQLGEYQIFLIKE